MEEEKFQCVRTPATKKKLEKVTNMVGTFLKGNRDSFQIPTANAKSEKVAATVATFLNKDGD